MKICSFCNAPSDEVEILEGIGEEGIITVCMKCSEEYNVPLLKKPSIGRLKEADRHVSVRERMERISGYADTKKRTELSLDQENAQRSLGRLRAPPKKQSHELLVDNYDWNLKMGRRRKKLTFSQLSEETGVFVEDLQKFERGIIPSNDKLEEIALKLEKSLDVTLLRKHPETVKFMRTSEDEQKEILENVRQKIENNEINERDREDKLDKIQKGKLDMSKRQNLQNVTLKDLIDLKRKRDKQEQIQKQKQQDEDLFGSDDDLELDLED